MKNQHWHRKGDQPKQPLHYTGCGLDNIYLLSGYEIVEDEDGKGVIIHNLDELHDAIALYLVNEQKILSGKEVHYLRAYMDLSQSGLGKLLGCNSQTVARYEKEEYSIPAPTDRLLRVILLGHVKGDVNVHQIVQKIENMEGHIRRKYKFAPAGKGWKAA